MIRKTFLLITFIYAITFLSPIAKAIAPDNTFKVVNPASAPLPPVVPDRIKSPERIIVFKHGDISWLPKLAIQSGWEANQITKLGQIILRESGGCPNRRGGDMVDKDCNIIGVSEWNHRSDTSLLQLNGINYDPTRNEWAPICLQMGICTQEPLFDPLTNLRAGKLLYDYWQKSAGNGWIPWLPQSPKP